MKFGISRQYAEWLVLIMCWPLLALAENNKPSVDNWSDDWEAAHCPGALPAEGSPYISRIEHYAETGEEEKRREMVAKHRRYVDCSVAIGSGAGIPILAYDSYESYMRMGDPESAELFTLEAALKQVAGEYDPSEPIYPILKELYEAGYTKEMVGMAEVNPDKAKDVLIKEYFCDCLSIPLEDLDESAVE